MNTETVDSYRRFFPSGHPMSGAMVGTNEDKPGVVTLAIWVDGYLKMPSQELSVLDAGNIARGILGCLPVGWDRVDVDNRKEHKCPDVYDLLKNLMTETNQSLIVVTKYVGDHVRVVLGNPSMITVP